MHTECVKSHEECDLSVKYRVQRANADYEQIPNLHRQLSGVLHETTVSTLIYSIHRQRNESTEFRILVPFLIPRNQSCSMFKTDDRRKRP